MAQTLRQKLNNADSKFFDEDPEDGVADSTIRKDLLTFRSAELKTVFTEVDDEIDSGPGKVHIFWEGHKILRNLHLTFDCMYSSQKLGEDFAKFCGLLRIYEL